MGVFEVSIDSMNVKFEGLTKFLQEMFPSGNKVIHENHDENKVNVNHGYEEV